MYLTPSNLCAYLHPFFKQKSQSGIFFSNKPFFCANILRPCGKKIFGRITSVVKRKDSKTSKQRLGSRVGVGMVGGLGWERVPLWIGLTIATGSYRCVSRKGSLCDTMRLWRCERFSSWFLVCCKRYHLSVNNSFFRLFPSQLNGSISRCAESRWLGKIWKKHGFQESMDVFFFKWTFPKMLAKNLFFPEISKETLLGGGRFLATIARHRGGSWTTMWSALRDDLRVSLKWGTKTHLQMKLDLVWMMMNNMMKKKMMMKMIKTMMVNMIKTMMEMTARTLYHLSYLWFILWLPLRLVVYFNL